MEEQNNEKQYKFMPKSAFVERMNTLLQNEKDRKEYWEIVHKEPNNSIRCNTLKISPEKLKKRLEEKGWKINQPYKDYPEIMIIENNLGPGELGKAEEHLLGYFYVQEISSMLSILALKPTEEDIFLDLCASPGSKTTQAAARMNNKGSIIANDSKLGRLIILASNLEKCGVSNTVITQNDGIDLCIRYRREQIFFDKILVDAPCSGEGTLRSSPETFIMWNEKMTGKFSRIQRHLAENAIGCLKVGGELLYSTCTHAPEENEEVVQHLLDNFDIEIQEINLPLKTRPGITEWQDNKFSEEMKKCVRIYPQDNDTEGFFVCKIKKLSDNKKEVNLE
jgi:NOL1/NOP2/sun family putative RNA methylase